MVTRTQVNLTEEVQGVMPVANGGTGVGTLTSGSLVVGNGTGVVNFLAPSTSGNVAQSNGSAWISQALTRATVPEANTTSSATSLTLTTTSSTWTFTGSSPTTWTLPTVSSSGGFELHIENRGTAAITIIPAGADHIWLRGSVTTMTVASNGSLTLGNDGTYWNAYSLDLINNSATLTSLPLVTPIVTGFTETVSAVGTVGATSTLSLGSGTMLWATLTSATACTFTMPTAATGLEFFLALRQPASGTPTTATFTGVKWPATGAPTITATVGKADLLSFICYDATNWYGTYVQGFTY